MIRQQRRCQRGNEPTNGATAAAAVGGGGREGPEAGSGGRRKALVPPSVLLPWWEWRPEWSGKGPQVGINSNGKGTNGIKQNSQVQDHSPGSASPN